MAAWPWAPCWQSILLSPWLRKGQCLLNVLRWHYACHFASNASYQMAWHKAAGIQEAFRHISFFPSWIQNSWRSKVQRIVKCGSQCQDKRRWRPDCVPSPWNISRPAPSLRLLREDSAQLCLLQGAWVKLTLSLGSSQGARLSPAHGIVLAVKGVDRQRLPCPWRGMSEVCKVTQPMASEEQGAGLLPLGSSDRALGIGWWLSWCTLWSSP